MTWVGLTERRGSKATLCFSSVFCCLKHTSFSNHRHLFSSQEQNATHLYRKIFQRIYLFFKQTYSSSNCNKQHTNNSKSGEKTLTVNKMCWTPQYTQTLCMLKHKLRKSTRPSGSVSIAITQKQRITPNISLLIQTILCI